MKLCSVFALAACLSTACASSAEEIARFALRGSVAETSVNPFTGKQQALLHIPTLSNVAYQVVCSDSYPECAATLNAAVGWCANVLGSADALFVSPPHSEEFLEVELVGFPTNCATARARFAFTGHITNYTTPGSSPTGQAEFDLTANGETFHLVCDPLFTSCDIAVQIAYGMGECVSVSGDIESFTNGFTGSTVVIHWTESLVSSSC